jgi:hypothetical protein
MGHTAIRRTGAVAMPRSIGNRLDTASRAIDAHFLELGRALGDAVEGLGNLVTSLDAIRAAIDGELVAAAIDELRAAARDLLSLPAHHAGRSGAIERLNATAQSLADAIMEMRRDLSYLRTFATSIKIAAGGIAVAGREFSDLAQEITDGIEQGRGHLEAFDADLATLRKGFKTASDHEKIRAAQCAELFPVVPDGLLSSADAMVEHHHQVARVAGEVGALVRDVQMKVGAALAALQIGDITRQRVEHASEALEMLDGMTDLSADQRHSMEVFIHGLVAAQLKAATSDFHDDVSRLSVALGGIAGDAAKMLRLRDLAFGNARDSGDGFLRQIERHVDQALVVVRDMAEADQTALAMGATVSEASAELSGKITELRAIKTDVQHMALNTTLKCSRLGDAGKPLAVIATELRLHANHMDVSAVQAMSSLDNLTGDALRMSQANTDETAGFSETVRARLQDVARNLRAAGDQVEADVASVANDGGAVVAVLRRASGSMGFQHEIGALIDDAMLALEDSADDAVEIACDIASPLNELLAKIAKRYTMVQEREVHRAMTERLGHVEAAAEPEAAASELEMDDVLF